jgi:hypothetical protein
MSGYLKSLDPNHLIAPGDWGYRSAAERREWLADHAIPTIDYCDVHLYPLSDHDSFVERPDALREFVDNRAAAALSIGKPLVFGEFGIGPDGYNSFSEASWYREFFDANLRAGSSGAIFWILTPDPNRGYSVTYMSDRDRGLLAEIKNSAEKFSALKSADSPSWLTDPARHLVPLQFKWRREPGAQETLPLISFREDKSVLYQFKPLMASAQSFEKIGSGPGYVWGSGSGYLEYSVPERADRRRVSEIVVRAHIQPVAPIDASRDYIKTRVTLFVNDWNCGPRLVGFESGSQPFIQEWRMTGWLLRLQAMRGLPLTIRFAVTPESDWLYGVNISNWPEGYDAKDARPVEVELRH